jgi:hypothetical protein
MIHKMSRSARTALLTTAILLAGLLPASADDFIRGDANGDGRVGISDSHAVLRHMQGTAPLACLDAGDANDDGMVSSNDDGWIVNVVIGHSQLVAPWGTPGPDPTTDENLGCDSYGGGLPYSDPTASAIVRHVTAEGGSHPYAVITLALTHGTAIGGYQFLIRDPAGVIANYRIGDSYEGEARYNDNLGPARYPGGSQPDKATIRSYARVTGGQMWIVHSAKNSFGDVFLGPQTDTDVLEFTICLKPGTTAGTYPLLLESAELVHYSTSRRIDPVLVDGSLTVIEDLDPGVGCTNRPDPTPENIEALLEIGDGSALPGDAFTLPVSIEASEFVAGYVLSIDFDEEVLEGTGYALTYTRPDGLDYDFQMLDIQNENDTPGNGGTDEGYIFAFAYFEFDSLSQLIPANTPTKVLDLEFRARPDAPVGGTEVAFIDGALSRANEPVSNSLYTGGELVDPENRDGYVFINGLINVLPDGAAFVRGDSNDDAAVDLSDAVSTLGWLFLGDDPPSCLDAADANDDGLLDIADPVATLRALFEGDIALPSPSGPGLDPTPDSLGCRA